jgi:hypothetical protein
MSPVALGLAALVRGYRLVLRPIIPASCRFTPSCSEYALESLSRHGAGRGSWLTLRRLLRCQPWGGFGYDPVPGNPVARRMATIQRHESI